MSNKVAKIYGALISGATAGLSDRALYNYVVEECPKASSKKIVKASLLALTDPDVKDANVLNVVYALAIKHRLDPATANDAVAEDQEAEGAPVEGTPGVTKVKKPRKHRAEQPSV